MKYLQLTRCNSIRIAFSVTDFSSTQPYDESYGDEADDIAQLANQGNNKARQPAIAPEDSIEDNEVEEHPSDESSFPAQLNITITKADRPGALVIDATARDNEISIENMAYFTDAALADPKTFELEMKRRPVYAGPPFGDLDEELQQYMQDYLAERGINEALAGFVVEYIDYKEHTEYVRWLSSKFLS
jgi:complement component 1 Q subcomponent-binding protein, mitochondrial